MGSRTVTIVAGIFLGIALVGIAIPAGLRPIHLVVCSAGSMASFSICSYLIFSLHGWPPLTDPDSRFSQLERSVMGVGLALLNVGLLIAAVQKLVDSYGLSPMSAGFFSAFGLGLYLCLWGVVLHRAMRLCRMPQRMPDWFRAL